jgi:hypothetical protein
MRGFIPHLRDHCEALAEAHPPLMPWILRRLAILEFHDASPLRTPPGLSDTEFALRRELLDVVIRGSRRDPSSAARARRLCNAALNGAAQATVGVLSRTGRAHASASLMVQVRKQDVVPEAFRDPELASHNSQECGHLWQTLPARDVLVVVSETDQASHLGFWVPTEQGREHHRLPGAPTAFFNLIGDAVFKADLPPVLGFDEAVGARWRAYMAGSFGQRLFVSLPLVASSPDGQAPRAALAVLNVNVDPIDPGDGWYRAYHPEWLAAAQDRAKAFVDIAYCATLVEMRGRTGLAVLGSGHWVALPGWED